MPSRPHPTVLVLTAGLIGLTAPAIAERPPSDRLRPIVDESTVFADADVDGVLAVEAEHFFKQTGADTRAWYLTTATHQEHPDDDADGAHVHDASGGAYLECLPDTRHHHGHALVHGENFANTPGVMAILHYKVNIPAPGRYYVWVRAYSTGSEDNGIHVGLDGKWPASGQRLQWCEGKHSWRWESKQRTQENHCGEPHKIFLDIDEAGHHEILFGMREDGFEFDKFFLTTKRDQKRPDGAGPRTRVSAGTLPEPFAVPVDYRDPAAATPAPTAVSDAATSEDQYFWPATEFPVQKSAFYVDHSHGCLAINPEHHREASVASPFPFRSGTFDVTLHAAGENDGASTYEVLADGKPIGTFKTPLSEKTSEQGPAFNATWENVVLTAGALLDVRAATGSIDGQASSRGRWSGLAFKPADEKPLGPRLIAAPGDAEAPAQPNEPSIQPRQTDGSGEIAISGEQQQWHKVTLTLDGPYAHEWDNVPNPFTDYRFTVTFTHASGSPKHVVPGYFAADGEAAMTSAVSGTRWRTHLSPDKPGTWHYETAFVQGPGAALDAAVEAKSLDAYSGKTGSFEVAPTDKTVPDLRARGRLEYVGKHHLQFAGDKTRFLKAGPDAPETLLAYEDFDGTTTKKTPLKDWAPHLDDWREGDPTWQDDKGKGLIGALNYLASKGVNAYSFLPYNAGGDGDNVWPFVARDAKFHYDCSKLDQWAIVFAHGQSLGLYHHFKLQEQENDDNRRGHNGDADGTVPAALDGGDLGNERKLYCRELIARFGWLLALNWNLGEENTQSAEQQRAMAAYLKEVDPYDHHIVVHTFPDRQDQVYSQLLGDQSVLTGASLQNSWKNAHQRTLKWIAASARAGRPWVVANDEQNPASLGVPPDPGYEGFDGKAGEEGERYDLHDIRKFALWGNLMAGGGGVEYYFGYQLPQNDLVCEDFRSRDRSWDFCRIAIEFFHQNAIPFWEMTNGNALVGNEADDNSRYCLAKHGEIYLVYLPDGGSADLDLGDADGDFRVKWFNPRTGGDLVSGAVTEVSGGARVPLGKAPAEEDQDWLIVLTKS